MDSCPDILVDANGLVGAPNKAAGKERKQKQKSIIQLCLRSGHVEFVEEPVEVQEWGRELVEDEGAAVEVDKWSL